ncbi:hypothetical protein LTS08_004147 [Lithohypha guttulata]|nr:hypothetical protein LTS08_004147 [Lithohypha guttulata]
MTTEAQKKIFNDPNFVSRYKLGEVLTVSKYAVEILFKTRLQNKLLPEDRFTCADMAPAMLDVLKARIGEENWSTDGQQFEVVQANMTDTKLPSDNYTHLGCNFGPGLAPQPENTLRESYRMLRPGGVAGWTFWQTVGWFPDVSKAMKEIRAAAEQKVADGTATENDRKLANIPAFLSIEQFIAKAADVDLNQTPHTRWDREDFVKAQVEEAGFTDVKVEVVKKDFTMDTASAYQMVKPMFGLLRNFWSNEDKEATNGVDIDTAMDQWWERRLKQDDIQDDKILWKDFTATVVTGRKAL